MAISNLQASLHILPVYSLYTSDRSVVAATKCNRRAGAVLLGLSPLRTFNFRISPIYTSMSMTSCGRRVDRWIEMMQIINERTNAIVFSAPGDSMYLSLWTGRSPS